MTVDILLATYNGERFLTEQIDSLLAQTAQGFRILARDDGSTDGTVALVNDYGVRFPGKIARLDDGQGNIGVVQNFSRLLEASTADYAMFCDQDDVWHTDKIARTLEAMRAMEARHGRDTPLLVHTDAEVVDETLQRMAPSHHKSTKLLPEHSPLPRLLIQNVAQGCTMMMNRALVTRAAPIPPEARMHDHWVALVAAATGDIGYLPQPTLRYRQHGANQVGAVRRRESIKAATRRAMRANAAQAGALLDRVAFTAPHGATRIIDTLAQIDRQSWLEKRFSLVTGGYFRRPWYQNLAVLAYA